MSELFNQFGLDPKLLIAQGLNFVVLLVILRAVAYKPLLKVLRERRERIEFGLKGAQEAEERLGEIESIKDEKLKEADKKALKVVAVAEDSAKKRWHEIVSDAEKKADSVLSEAETAAKKKSEQEMQEVFKNAGNFVKLAIERVCELDPSRIDAKLIEQAVEESRARTNSTLSSGK